nr:MAG TPA: Rifin [Caudoviricetes sp.]
MTNRQRVGAQAPPLGLLYHINYPLSSIMITFLNILTIVLDCIVIGISLAVIFRYFRKDK